MTISNYRAASIPTLTSPVTATEVDSRLQLLQQNIEFLSQVMETAREGSALIGYNAEIDSTQGIELGHPVYFDTDEQKFKLSQLALTAVGQIYVADPSSEVWGIVLKKCSDSRAHLLLDGIARIDMTESTGEASPTGKYYLSTTLGTLQDTPDPLLVQPIVLGTGNGDILFRPFFADNYPRFVPRTLPITATPSGTVSQAGQIVTIPSPNAATAGWLPAGHASFDGNAPAGAYFGYNLAQDSAVGDIWPPLYPSETQLLIDPGGNRSRGYFTILGNDSARCIVNEHGIWWMTNCAGQLPWDMLADGATGQTACPKSLLRKMAIEGQFAGEMPQGLDSVSSLTSLVPWLKVYKAGTETTASRGNLELAISANDWIRETPLDYSHLGLKGMESNQFTLGPLVTSIRSGSPSLQITGGTEVTDDEESPGENAGRLTLTVNAAADSDLLPLRSQLFGATTESYKTTIAFGLRPGVDASFVNEFYIPKAIPAASTIRFAITFLASETIAIPDGLTVQVLQLPEVTSGFGTVGEYSSLFLNYQGGTTFAAGTYRTYFTATMTVTGGDSIYMKLSRAGASDGVGGQIQVLKAVARFT